ncbi:MAG: outer membrane beta-barrel protein [Gemmatimonadetes bacterium]|nr:outer membrane beta-barrel protein [Candidatus Palauibacter rhopaloidicola]
MLRRLVASLLPLLVAAPLMAQTMVGIRAGLNRATFSAFVEEELLELENLGGATSEDPRMGAIAGIDVAFPLTSAVELRLGGAYAQKGYSLSLSGPGGSGFTGFEMDYLQFSALARVGSARDGPVSVGVLLGPWMAYRVSCQLSVDFDLEEFGPIRESGSCSADGAKIDFGVAAGGGVELAVSDGLSLGLDLVYSLGLSRIDDDPDSPKNRSLAVQAGVVIPVGG